MKKKLVLHLGLHKTATTSLQSFFFPQVAGYLGKSRAPRSSVAREHEAPNLVKNLKAIAWGGVARFGELEGLIRQIDFSEQPTRLISDEGLSAWPQGPKQRVPVQRSDRSALSRRGTHPVVPFLRALESCLPEDVELVTIIVLRAQPEYLASLSAEKGVNLGSAVRRVVKRKDEFILWHRLVNDLESLRGPEKNLTLIFEDGLDFNARLITKHCGLIPVEGSFRFDPPQRENVKRQSDGTWQKKQPKASGNLPKVLQHAVPRSVYLAVRGGVLRFVCPGKIRLTSSQRRRIRKYCASSNQLLADHLGRELGSLGY
jgi:hypothetical protein